MRWHGTRHSVAWRGVAWDAIPCHTRAIAFMITIQDSRSPKTNTTSFSPRLIFISSRLGAFGNPGFPWGFPIASPKLPPISGKSHKHPSLSHPSRLQLVLLFFNLLSLAATLPSWGYPPALAKLQVTSLPHTFHLRALHLEFACFSLWTKQPPLTPVHPDPPSRELPLLCHRHFVRPFSCSVILHSHSKPNFLPLLLPLSALAL
jgi:hypothetical protein